MRGEELAAVNNDSSSQAARDMRGEELAAVNNDSSPQAARDSRGEELAADNNDSSHSHVSASTASTKKHSNQNKPIGGDPVHPANAPTPLQQYIPALYHSTQSLSHPTPSTTVFTHVNYTPSNGLDHSAHLSMNTIKNDDKIKYRDNSTRGTVQPKELNYGQRSWNQSEIGLHIKGRDTTRGPSTTWLPTDVKSLSKSFENRSHSSSSKLDSPTDESAGGRSSLGTIKGSSGGKTIGKINTSKFSETPTTQSNGHERPAGGYKSARNKFSSTEPQHQQPDKSRDSATTGTSVKKHENNVENKTKENFKIVDNEKSCKINKSKDLKDERGGLVDSRGDAKVTDSYSETDLGVKPSQKQFNDDRKTVKQSSTSSFVNPRMDSAYHRAAVKNEPPTSFPSLSNAATSSRSQSTEWDELHGLSNPSSCVQVNINPAGSLQPRSGVFKSAPRLVDIEMVKGPIGLGFCIEGGIGSPVGDKPIIVKRLFKGKLRFMFYEALVIETLSLNLIINCTL